MNSTVQSPAHALFALEEINVQRPQYPEGCELCQHCTLLQALFRVRHIKKQDYLKQAQGEYDNVEQL